MKYKISKFVVLNFVIAVLRGMFVAINTYIIKEVLILLKKISVNNVSFHQKKLEREGKNKHKTSRKKELIKTRIEIN